MGEVKLHEWIDERGVMHKIPKGACPICKFCTDIFLDPWHNNRIYACVCSKHDETIPCDDFVLQKE